MKKLGQAITVFLLMGLFFTTAVSADTEELSINERKSLIVEVAREYDIPPEILLAMAYEESQFKQFENGEVFRSTNGDGGYGIMQITDPKYISDEIKNNTRANIEAGAKILNDKWGLVDRGVLPSIKTGGSEPNNKELIEHWYFVIMAYNGVVETNIPKDTDVSFEEMAYQEQVFVDMRKDRGQLNLLDTEFLKDIEYDVNANGVVSFKEGTTINFDGRGTYSGMDFETGSNVYLMNNYPDLGYGNFYPGQTLNRSNRDQLAFYTPFEILDDELVFTENNQKENHFAYYKVKRGDEVGYISSSNLNLSERNKTAFTALDKPAPVTVVPSKTFTINFSEKVKLQESSVNNRNMYIVREDGMGVLANVRSLDNQRSIEINPTTNLESGKTYTLYVKDAKSTEGVLMKKPIQHTFTVQ